MSIEALNWAFNLRIESPADKLCLLCLANFASADGDAWPSVQTLVQLSSMSERTVRRSLRSLEAAGLIVGTERPQNTTVYRLSQPGRGVTVTPGVSVAPEPNSTEPSKGKEKKGSGVRVTAPSEQRLPLPPEWWPPADQIAWARAAFPAIDKEIEHETHKFVAHSEETGRTHARPLAAWRRWISNAAIYAARNTARPGPGRKLDAASLSSRNAATVDRVLGELFGGEDVVGHDLDPVARAQRRA